MDNLTDYAIDNPWFNGARVTAVNDETFTLPEYCCEEMAAICSEIDGFFYGADNYHELDNFRRTEYYQELCRQRSEHKCLHPITKELLDTLKTNPDLYNRFSAAVRENSAKGAELKPSPSTQTERGGASVGGRGD